MHTVLCGIDESGSPEAVQAAVDYCREHRADLRLVGLVQDKLSDSTRGMAGERVRRSKTVRSSSTARRRRVEQPVCL